MNELQSKSSSNKPKLKRIAIKIGLSFALISIAILVSILALNWQDEALNTETKVLLEKPQYKVTAKENSFFMLDTLAIHSSLDPLAEGIHQFSLNEDAFYQVNTTALTAKASLMKSDLPSSSLSLSKCADNSCLDYVLQNRKEFEKIIQENSVLLSRFERFKNMPEFEEHFIPAHQYISPSLSKFTNALHMQLAQATFAINDGRTQEGIDVLQSNDAIIRKLMSKTTSLISRMTMISLMHRHTKILSELSENYPNLVKNYRATLLELARPLSVEELDFSQPIQNEARFAIHLFRNEKLSEYSIIDQRIHRNFLSNAYLNYFNALQKEYKQGPKNYDNFLERVESQVKFKDFALHRFISKGIYKLTNISGEAMLTYFKKNTDLDGYLRLVNLQIQLQATEIKAENIPAWLEKTPMNLRNPYDDKPMQWNKESGELFFEGKNFHSDSNGNQLFKVKLNTYL
jgi:hypothetical protein